MGQAYRRCAIFAAHENKEDAPVDRQTPETHLNILCDTERAVDGNPGTQSENSIKTTPRRALRLHPTREHPLDD